ncbi:hypothetical protein N658DRAFT_459415 [Parathielavia hyrcaniae]|uniref:Uncharacterized protein n=1 Tax=Parathielavia hyrcaniae TaxID=113614 RepID=A0AAN6PQQ0_9PEZI|nr:hypothetical protein N658DRAFT_459415 [Parathielavia hyrcaniae]
MRPVWPEKQPGRARCGSLVRDASHRDGFPWCCDFYDPPEALHGPDEVAGYLGEPVRPVNQPLQW